MTNETILKMIESVDPGDSKGLDEIDARVFGFLRRWDFIDFEVNEDEFCGDFGDGPEYDNVTYGVFQSESGQKYKRQAEQFTRSRDGLPIMGE